MSNQLPSLPAFVTRWRASTLTEKSAAQTHFIELCQVLGKPWPTPGNGIVNLSDKAVRLAPLEP